MSTSTPTSSSFEAHTVPLPGGIPPTHRPHTESRTTILVPNENVAFLNPVQQYNRDLSVAVIRAWGEMRKEELEAKWRKKGENMRRKGAKAKGKQEAAGAAGVEQPEAEAGPSTERTFRPPRITILEALSATGLRSIRYAKEIPDVRVVLANDLSPSACEAMRMNVAFNGVEEPPRSERKVVADGGEEEPVEGSGQRAAGMEVDPEESALNAAPVTTPLLHGRREGCNGKVRINEGDACTLMYQHRDPRSRVDVVDLDPYGTAAPFVDAAIGAVADGGLLCVTCTDLAVLAGSQYPEKCYSNYGGSSVNAEFCHEVAIRLVLHLLATTAARYGRYITPLLSFSIDFYVRIFVRVGTGPEKVKATASQVGAVYTCHYCQSPHLQPFGRVVERETKGGIQKQYRAAQGPPTEDGKCNECGSVMHLGGPMWLGPIQDPEFAQRALKSIEGQHDEYGTWSRMNGMLSLAAEELADPFYFTTNKLSGFMHMPSLPTSHMLSALLNAGYRVSRSHALSGSVKTNAPRSFVLDVLREMVKSNPVRMDKISETSPARKLLAKEMTHTVDLTPHPDVKKFERQKDLPMYPVNAAPNWGPGSRAKSVQHKEKRKVADGGEEGQGKKAKVADNEGAGEEDAFNA